MSTFKFILAIVVPVVLAAIIFQNTAAVTIRFLFWSFSIPQIVLIIITALLGITGGYLLASFQQMRARRKSGSGLPKGGNA